MRAIVSRDTRHPGDCWRRNTPRRCCGGKGVVTASCAEGDVGRVYDGDVPFEIVRTDLTQVSRPATEIMINLGNPELAFKTSFIPNDGVGLARMEFIINEYIKIHPMALLHPEKGRGHGGDGTDPCSS